MNQSILSASLPIPWMAFSTHALMLGSTIYRIPGSRIVSSNNVVPFRFYENTHASELVQDAVDKKNPGAIGVAPHKGSRIWCTKH